MRVFDIKNKARSMLINRGNIFYIVLIISIISMFFDYLVTSLNVWVPFISFLLSILILPLEHGKVVSSLKLVNERSDEINVKTDVLTGFKRYGELFFTYFIRAVFLIVIDLFIALILFVIAKMVISADVLENFISVLINESMYGGNIDVIISDPVYTQLFVSISGILMLGMILYIVVNLVYSYTFFLTPYILEKNKIYGIKAMSESARMMKGHRMTVFLLDLSYIGWYLLIIICGAVLNIGLSNSFIVSIIIIVASVYLFAVNLQVSYAIVFEEINLEDKNML